MEIEKKLIQNLIKIKYDDLPERVVETAKMTILDTMGAMLGGAAAEGCGQLVSQVRDWEGIQESIILS